MRDAVRSTGEECVRYPYCGAAYYLPVLSLVPHAHAMTAPRPPRITLAATLALAPAPTLGTERLLTVDLTGTYIYTRMHVLHQHQLQSV